MERELSSLSYRKEYKMLIRDLEKLLKQIESEDVKVLFDMKDSAVVEIAIVRKNGHTIIISPKAFMTGRNYLELKV